MHEGKYSCDFLYVHTFAYEETRLTYLTLGEKRDPPGARKKELQWAINVISEYAQCMQTWCENHDFYNRDRAQKVRIKFVANRIILN